MSFGNFFDGALDDLLEDGVVSRSINIDFLDGLNDEMDMKIKEAMEFLCRTSMSFNKKKK